MLIQERTTEVRFHFREVHSVFTGLPEEQGCEKNDIRWKIMAPTFGEHTDLNI